MPLATVDNLNSERICHHMNDEHAAAVYGMVADLYPSKDTIRETKMIRFSLDRLDFTFQLNQKEMHTFIPFTPPLSSIKEARPRIEALYHEALTPKLKWIYTDPVSIVVVIVCCFLAYATHGLGVTGMVSVMDHAAPSGMISFLQTTLSLSSASRTTTTLAQSVVNVWYFTIMAHIVEALFVGIQAKKRFRLKDTAILEWCLVTFIFGLPMLNRFATLMEIDIKSQKERAMRKKE